MSVWSIGTVLGRYTIVRVVDERRFVAEAGGSQFWVRRVADRTHRRASAAAIPGVADETDVVLDGEGAAILYALPAGELLSERERAGRLALPLAVTYVRQAAEILEVAHARGLGHGAISGDVLYALARPAGPTSPGLLILECGLASAEGATARPVDDRAALGRLLAELAQGSPQATGVAAEQLSRIVGVATDLTRASGPGELATLLSSFSPRPPLRGR